MFILGLAERRNRWVWTYSF